MQKQRLEFNFSSIQSRAKFIDSFSKSINLVPSSYSLSINESALSVSYKRSKPNFTYTVLLQFNTPIALFALGYQAKQFNAFNFNL